MARRSGLGRGLGALIPTDATGGDAGSGLRELAVGDITPNPHQPRAYFDEEALASLTASVAELGVLQPVLVREVGDEKYELIAGERRWRAAKRAGLPSVPAVVRTVDEVLSLEQALVENLHRADLNPLEEAAAYQQLIEDFELTQEAVAQKVGRSRSAVANTLRLFQLPPTIQRLLAENQLAAGHAKALLGTPDRAFQEGLAKRIVADGLSVREAEEAVRLHNEADDVEPELAEASAPGPRATARRRRRQGQGRGRVRWARGSRADLPDDDRWRPARLTPPPNAPETLEGGSRVSGFNARLTLSTTCVEHCGERVFGTIRR